MRYQRLFELQVRHGAYPAGRCTDLQIIPSATLATGGRALARHRFVTRTTPMGIEVVGQVSSDGQSKISFGGAFVLTFDLCALGNNFTQLTNLESWSGVAAPTFRGSGAKGGSVQLLAGAHGSQHPPGVIAVIEIAGIDDAWFANPPSFTLEFKPRELLWTYYLLTSRSKSEPPRIEDGDPKRPLSFVRKQLTESTTSASVDPVGHRLLRRHPDRQCFRMVAKRPLAAEQVARRQLALYLGDELLIRQLATPSIHDFTILTLKPSAPRDSIYRVVEY